MMRQTSLKENDAMQSSHMWMQSNKSGRRRAFVAPLTGFDAQGSSSDVLVFNLKDSIFLGNGMSLFLGEHGFTRGEEGLPKGFLDEFLSCF
jgi:hypothetical protein